MQFFIAILSVLSTIVTSITVSSNGNSPEIKMIGGMMVDVQKGFVPLIQKKPEETTLKNYYDKNKKLNINSTKLSINERYRRLIPYMTFYYANDIVTPTTETYTTKSIEVEKAEIVEAGDLEQTDQREPKKIVYSSYRNIPRYQGNRLTQYNIASANPTKIYKDVVTTFQSSAKITPNYNLLISEHTLNHDHGRLVQKQIVKTPSVPFSPPSRKPYLNFFNNEDSANVRYYLSEKELAPKFTLVPYEQTPPVKVVPQNEKLYNVAKKPIPVPVLLPKEQVFTKPRLTQHQYLYDNVNIQQPIVRKQPVTISENYYEKQRPHFEITQPIIEGGFKPITGPPVFTTEAPVYTSTLTETPFTKLESEKQKAVQIIEPTPLSPEITDYRPNYYQYVIEQSTPKSVQKVPSNTHTLGDILNTLQLNKYIPKPITRENVGASIRTLIQILNALKEAPQQNDVKIPVLSTPKPFVTSKIETKVKPDIESTPIPAVAAVDFQQEPYLAPINTPSQHLDDFSTLGGSTQQFPLPVTSDDEGGTPGRPGVDYPILTIIPQTSFNCKTQRYKGFFADPETRCQVWHYCDLNGGQASFLCPNGTIFSQAALTCDWWFNVRCASTTQLYVLNESLYKYILPHSPKFPEDYSGPLVDKYLTLKFKEMEEQFKKNKNKQAASEKVASNEDDDTSEEADEKSTDNSSNQLVKNNKNEVSTVSEASVVVVSPGTSGNVERLHN